MSTKYNSYGKGSEWRKWDLHAHTPLDHEWKAKPDLSTPEKKKQFAVEYIKFAKEQGLAVIAITDHNFCNDIDDLLIPYINTEAIANGITILPGFEVTASDGSGIHVLVIFRENSDLKLIKKIVDQLFPPGTELMPSTGIVPVSNKKIQEIHEIIEGVKLEHIMIFAHADRENGVLHGKTINGQRRVEEWQAPNIRICQISKSPKEFPEDTFFHNVFNGADGYYRKDMRYILASDCRSITVEGNDEGRCYLGQKFVWLKADPNFNGLKQIIYEADRVYIGENAPEKLPSAKIITSIEIKKNNSWFEDRVDVYCFNEGQISIIGGKGAGKTALLDLIAYGCHSLDIGDQKSFLHRASKELEGIEVVVNWKDGESMSNEITKKLKPPIAIEKQPILYLSQSFVEGLVEPHKMQELTNQIEKVVFQNIDDELRAGFISFTDLKRSNTSVINANKERVLGTIRELNKSISLRKAKISTKELVSEEVKTKAKENKDVLASIELLKKGETDADAEKMGKLAMLSKEKGEIEKRLADRNKVGLLKKEIVNDIEMFRSEGDLFVRKISSKLRKLGFDASIIDSIKLELTPSDLVEKLNSNSVDNIKDTTKDRERLTVIKTSIQEIENELKTEETRITKLKELSVELEKISLKIANLNGELKLIEEYESEMTGMESDRNYLIYEYFTYLYNEKCVLEKLYAPLVKKLEESEEENTHSFEFEVLIKKEMGSISDRIQELIDRNKTGNYHKKLGNDLTEDLEGIELNLDFNNIADDKDFYHKNAKAIALHFQRMEQLFTRGKDGTVFAVKDQLKTKYAENGEEDFYNWLFDLSNYKVEYVIKFNQTSLDKLSPGLKGLALLILYLELDKEDRRPLLIDQPEENLDNRSVFETLCKYFINAKKRRQIFIVTHNPNLVVNTDSEQVFVSNFSKDRLKQPVTIFHVSGSLENSLMDSETPYTLHKQGIKQHICQILEGGEEAFKARERKYEIH